MPDTFYVAPDAQERLKQGDIYRMYQIPWQITGTLEIKATDAEDAWKKAIRFSEQQLAITGNLEMSDPEEKGAVQ